jgi:hypothetical protein
MGATKACAETHEKSRGENLATFRPKRFLGRQQFCKNATNPPTLGQSPFIAN